nr:DUF6583 family protein [Lysinibacillus timonensis]
MNEDNQNPSQNENPNQHPNPSENSNQNQYVDSNQNQTQYGSQNPYGNPNQAQFGDQNIKPQKLKSKKLAVSIVSIAFVLLLAAGGAFAYFNMSKSPKDKLLMAELNSWGQMKEVFETRYQPELEWAKKAETTPSEYTYDIGASVDGDFYSYEEMMAAEVISNSLLSLDIQMDPNKQVMKASLGAEIQGVTIDPLSGYITTEKLMFGFPFTDDILQVKDEDFGNFMKTVDPLYEGSEKLGLSDWMGKNSFLSEENMKYLQKEYLLHLYNSIPAEAFTESEEEIEVFGETLKATKISMDLSGEQLKEITLNVFNKAKNDSKFKDIVIETLENATGAVGTLEEDYDFDMDEVLNTMIEELENTDIPNGIKYSVWINSDVIVQSELEIGDFIMEGTRLFTENTQEWDYKFDNGYEEYLYFQGELSYENGKIKDYITMNDDYGNGLIYEGSEEVNGGERTFDRTLSIEEYDEVGFEFNWNGESSYEADKMNAEHHFGFWTYDFDFELTMDETGTFIKSVDIPSDNIVDLGAMSSDEINRYMEEEFIVDAQEWFMNLVFELGIY